MYGLPNERGVLKNGDDRTQQGVLKMLTLSAPDHISPLQYLKTLNVVPMSISYEFDPTDALKNTSPNGSALRTRIRKIASRRF